MSRIRPAVVVAAVLALGLPRAAMAQQLPPRGTTPQEAQRQIESLGLEGRLLDRLQASGMSPDQVRQRLAQMGYDPSLLDAYLDPSAARPARPDDEVLSAAEALGLLQPRTPDSLMFATSVRPMPDSSAIERDRDLRVFGLDIFRRGTTEFQPLTTGPVPPNYMVGPGDELVLILTGDVERAYNLPVSREGFVVIPQVGQVWVNGMTLDEVRNALYVHLGRAYSGVRRGPEATTQFQLTLGQLRPNQVFVSGEVAEPGTYLVNSVASALTALYQAGGPTPNGSFRDVRVMRGGEMAHRLDLYAYLLQGHNLSEIQMQPGDVIFVPVHHAQVSIAGEVSRPAVYEVLPDETILDLIAFAGGLSAPAHLRHARITRVLPPSERTSAGVDRITIDVDLAAAVRDPSTAPTLRPGDEVQIFPVRSEVRRTVSIGGAVWRAGTFRLEEGMRAWDLIRNAEGLRDDAYTGRAQIVRLDPQDSTFSMIPFSLARDEQGQPVENPALQEFDALRVFAESAFTTSFPVTITGEIRGASVDSGTLTLSSEGVAGDSSFIAHGFAPVSQTFRYTDGLTLRDLVLRAGGLRPTADLTIEIARLADPTRRDTLQIARLIHVTVDSTYFVSDQDRRHYLGDFVEADPAADDFLLRPFDRVLVRPLAELEFQRSVHVAGEVRYPGSYSLESKDEKLASLVRRAGGVTQTAFAGGARFYRNGTLVNVDLEEALDNRRGRQNITLLPGDSIFVPEYNPVVLVQGAINSPEPVQVLYREGAELDHYIENAGGYSRFADRDGVNIRYANGAGATVDHVLLFRRMPEPGPGSVITVPALREEDRTDIPGLIADLAQVAAALTTVALVLTRF